MAASVSRMRQVCWGLTILSASKPLWRHFKWAEGQSNNRGGLIIKAWKSLRVLLRQGDLTLENVLQIKSFSNHLNNRNLNYFIFQIKTVWIKQETGSLLSLYQTVKRQVWVCGYLLYRWKYNLNSSVVTSCCVWVHWTAISCFMQNHTFAIQMCTVHRLSVMLPASQLFP